MGNTTIDPELKALQDAERARVEAEAVAAKTEREAADAAEIDALDSLHSAQASALGLYNQTQYENIGQIVSDIQGKVDAASVKDEAARKRENTYRYISGLGDILSSFANLVGVTKGAANQQQTYNSHAVVQKAEEARKARKLEMDDLSKRLDEMKARQRELKAAGSLKEAELAAANAKEKAELTKAHRTAEQTEKKFYANRSEDAAEEAARNYFKQQEIDVKANKPAKQATDKSRIIKIVGDNGEMLDFDVSGFKNFDADYQRALAAAIADGTSGLSDDELEKYNKAAKIAPTEGDRALKEFFRTHTPRQSIIKRMGINNPRYK